MIPYGRTPPRGLIARTAINQKCPDTRGKGHFLYVGESPLNTLSRVTELYDSAIDFYSAIENDWEWQSGGVYRHAPGHGSYRIKDRKTLRHMPLGTRFRYIGQENVYVVLQNHRCGLVARWEGNDAPVVSQGIFSFAEDEVKAETLQVEVITCTES